MAKRKILFVITKGNFGGAQRYVFDLATSLPKSQFEAVVAYGEGELLAQKLEEVSIRTININKLVREVKITNEFRVCKELVGIIRTEKPDIINLNSSKIGGIGAVAGRIASWLEKDYRPKIIFTSHGWGFYEMHRSFFLRMFYYLSHWITIMLCDITIAVSERTKRDISSLPFIKDKIKVIHNGISKFETLPREEAREILAPSAQEKAIIFSISELHNNKGVDVAIRAISFLTQDIKDKIIYVVAGAGEEKENLEKLILDLNLEQNVRLLGFVDNAKSLLSGADIFLFPSRTENLPFAILEAGLASLPVISTGVGGIPEIITDMQSGILVPKESPKEIAEAIKYLLSNPKREKSLGSNLKKQVSKNFSKKQMVEETISLYINVFG